LLFRRAEELVMKLRILAAAGAVCLGGCRMCSDVCDSSPSVTDGPYAVYATMPGSMIDVGVVHPPASQAPEAPIESDIDLPSDAESDL